MEVNKLAKAQGAPEKVGKRGLYFSALLITKDKLWKFYILYLERSNFVSRHYCFKFVKWRLPWISQFSLLQFVSTAMPKACRPTAFAPWDDGWSAYVRWGYFTQHSDMKTAVRLPAPKTRAVNVCEIGIGLQPRRTHCDYYPSVPSTYCNRHLMT